MNSSRPSNSASVFPPPHLIITRNAHGAEEGEGLGTRLASCRAALTCSGTSGMLSIMGRRRQPCAMGHGAS